jgi:hypothetical protein
MTPETLLNLSKAATLGPWKNMGSGRLPDDPGAAALTPIHECEDEDCPDGDCDCDRKAMDDAALISTMRNMIEPLAELWAAVEALGAMPEGYCYCNGFRDAGQNNHDPECRDIRAALAALERAEGGRG